MGALVGRDAHRLSPRKGASTLQGGGAECGHARSPWEKGARLAIAEGDIDSIPRLVEPSPSRCPRRNTFDRLKMRRV